MISVTKRYTDEDIPTLYRLEELCFSRSLLWTKKDFPGALKKSDVYLAREKGVIVGFLLAEEQHKEGYIATIDVHPDHRGKGIATLLIKEVEKDYKKKYKEMKLHVNVDNQAQTLYFKLGYRVKAVKEHYYADKTSALKMVKKL